MAGKSELGISPFLLQAIAQTLTSSSGGRESNKNTLESQLKPEDSLNKSKMDCNRKDSNSSNGIVTQLLQNLNEPIASLLSNQKDQRTQNAPVSVPSSFSQNVYQPNVITQAGLSMLGLSESDGYPSASSSLASVQSDKEIPANHNSQTTNMVISSEEITNFLMKQEVHEDLHHQQQDVAPLTLPSSQGVNTDVSSMLTALASQHMQESLMQKSGDLSSVPTSFTSNGQNSTLQVGHGQSDQSSSNGNRSQPQIIIYTRVDNNETTSQPVSVSTVNSNLTPVDSNAERTFTVVVKSPEEAAVETKPNVFSAGASTDQSFTPSTSVASVTPVTDALNIHEGMMRPCPVCGDKVSGEFLISLHFTTYLPCNRLFNLVLFNYIILSCNYSKDFIFSVC